MGKLPKQRLLHGNGSGSAGVPGNGKVKVESTVSPIELSSDSSSSEELLFDEYEAVTHIQQRVLETFEDPMLDIYSTDSNSDESDAVAYPRMYTWEKVVPSAKKARKNVQHFPRDVTKMMLSRNQKAIELINEDNGDAYYAEVGCAKRNNKVFKNEKYLGRGWYEFAENKKLKRGDMLSFKIGYPSKRVSVSVVNR